MNPVTGIIGGTGFLGLNLSRYLQQKGQLCRTLSRNGLFLPQGDTYASDLSRVEHIKGDFADANAVRGFVRPCQRVVVMVSHLLPSSSPQEIKTTIAWFSPAFVQLLEACSSAGTEQVVFVSSGGTIYGENPTGKPVDENHPLNPHCAYGSFCAFLEQLVHTFHNQHGLPYTILRLGNPYGPFKRPGRQQGLMDHYIRSARAERPFTVFGNGDEVRDYIYIDDLSRVIAAVLDGPISNTVFNVGTGRPHTSREVIAAINRHFELPKVDILFGPRRLGDVGCSLLSMAKFEKAYGFRCETTLEEGLAKYAAYEASTIPA